MDLAGIGTLLTGAGTLITAIIGYRNHRSINAVHATVNGTAQQQVNRVEQLVSVLADSGLPIPPTPNPPEPEITPP